MPPQQKRKINVNTVGSFLTQKRRKEQSYNNTGNSSTKENDSDSAARQKYLSSGAKKDRGSQKNEKKSLYQLVSEGGLDFKSPIINNDVLVETLDTV